MFVFFLNLTRPCDLQKEKEKKKKRMARCCAVITGDGITGSLMLHQAQEEAPTTIDGVIKGLTPVRK